MHQDPLNDVPDQRTQHEAKRSSGLISGVTPAIERLVKVHPKSKPVLVYALGSMLVMIVLSVFGVRPSNVLPYAAALCGSVIILTIAQHAVSINETKAHIRRLAASTLYIMSLAVFCITIMFVYTAFQRTHRQAPEHVLPPGQANNTTNGDRPNGETKPPPTTANNTRSVQLDIKIQPPGPVKVSLKTMLAEGGWDDLHSPFTVDKIVICTERTAPHLAPVPINNAGSKKAQGAILGSLEVVPTAEGGDDIQWEPSGSDKGGIMEAVLRTRDSTGTSFDIIAKFFVWSEGAPVGTVASPSFWCDVDTKNAFLPLNVVDWLMRPVTLKAVNETSDSGGKCIADLASGAILYTPKQGFEGVDGIMLTLNGASDPMDKDTKPLLVRAIVRVKHLFAAPPELQPESDSYREQTRHVVFRAQVRRGTRRTFTLFDDSLRNELVLATSGGHYQRDRNKIDVEMPQGAQGEIQVDFVIQHEQSFWIVCEGLLIVSPM